MPDVIKNSSKVGIDISVLIVHVSYALDVKNACRRNTIEVNLTPNPNPNEVRPFFFLSVHDFELDLEIAWMTLVSWLSERR